MSIPEEVAASLETHVGSWRLQGAVGGGCIHPSFRLRASGRDYFLKYGKATPPGFFAAEAEGLRQLRAATERLRVPDVCAFGDAQDAYSAGHGWLLLEWLEPERRASDFSRRLGEGLAELHRRTEAAWGWERDGYIGTLAQCNEQTSQWAEFWGMHRLRPQLELAERRGRAPGTPQEWDRLLDHLPQLLEAGEIDGPALLHGDLWGGNILAVAGGEAAIVDPAAYRGHREVDLAMAELFGGLDRDFFDAYERQRPLLSGYREWRRGIYQLYYLLVHVNIFGDGYVPSTEATLRRVLASI